MKTVIDVGIVDLIIFAGVLQGLLLTWFFLKNAGKEKPAHLFQGILILVLSLSILEEFLNNTGYIVKFLPIANFAEPFNLAYGPLLYLYVKRSLNPRIKKKEDSLHFIVFFIYLLYMGFFFLQPEAVKYNSYIHSKHPDWPKLAVNYLFSEDPLGIRSIINPITAIHFSFYLLLTGYELWFGINKRKALKRTLQTEKINELKSSTIHFIALIIIFIVIKSFYERDLGDYFISIYITFLFFITSSKAINSSSFFEKTHSFLNIPVDKYKKSSLTEDQKKEILSAIKKEMEENKYFSDNLVSLSNLAKRINESTHHVSQVINEKMNRNFYELVAWYRIEEAKKLLKNRKNLTIEEIAENVGYNSKSSFNTTFKKLTGMTPSAYRNG